MKKQFERLQAARVGEGEGGFTLIELLIVIVILGVLAAVVVFSVSGITDTGEKSACKSDLKTIETAIEAYYASQTPQAWPASLDAIVTAGLIHSDATIAGNAKTTGTYTITYTPATHTVAVTTPAGGCDAIT